ncbi:MAG: LytTR family DNA-binding domain-containing protein [Serpentinimonas sp.]|jgi:DNA-binding LytR/AlgR family response regulator|nr:LytTR family DNA-binding domain-containing protein [Serpentinimonas sp.]
MTPTALIAEDEPLLAAALQTELQRAWPALEVVATVGDGTSAVEQALLLQPHVLFLDIRMPGLTGLEAAAELADAWPSTGRPFPMLVFVTAYDQYAVQAFEAQALDYLLKPVVPERLARTVQRLQAQWAAGSSPTLSGEDPLERVIQRLQALLEPGALASATPSGVAAAPPPPPPPLRVIQASVGSDIRLIPLEEVLVLEAADKYLRVLTAEADCLIRTPLRELLPQLPPQDFWQIHRGTVVRASAIHSAHRDASGRLSLRLRGRSESWPVSRLYAGRFKAM